MGDHQNDGPGLGKGLLQMLSVSYPRATLDYDLPEEYADRLDEIRDHPSPAPIFNAHCVVGKEQVA